MCIFVSKNCLIIVFGNWYSIWIVDLVYLLWYFKVDVVFFIVIIGVNLNFVIEIFYKVRCFIFYYFKMFLFLCSCVVWCVWRSNVVFKIIGCFVCYIYVWIGIWCDNVGCVLFNLYLMWCVFYNMVMDVLCICGYRKIWKKMGSVWICFLRKFFKLVFEYRYILWVVFCGIFLFFRYFLCIFLFLFIILFFFVIVEINYWWRIFVVDIVWWIFSYCFGW